MENIDLRQKTQEILEDSRNKLKPMVAAVSNSTADAYELGFSAGMRVAKTIFDAICESMGITVPLPENWWPEI